MNSFLSKLRSYPATPWIFSIFLMAAIFAFSAIPADRIDAAMDWIQQFIGAGPAETPPPQPYLDVDWLKVGHAVGYGLLGGSLYFAFLQKKVKPVLAVLLTVLLYAATDEFHQSFVPGRSGSGVDVILDTASAVLVAMIARVRTLKRARSNDLE